MITVKDFKKGNKFKFKCGSEQLIFIGISRHGGKWYQLAKVETPEIVWSEVCDRDFDLLERIT